MSRQGEPRSTRSIAAGLLSRGNKGGGRKPTTLKRQGDAATIKAELALLTAMVAEFHDKLEAQAKLPTEYRGQLQRTHASYKRKATATPRGVEGEPATITQGGSPHTDSSPSTDSSTTDVSHETLPGKDAPPASVPSALDGYEKRLEAMGLRVPVPVVPDEIWQFLEGAEAIEDGHLRLQKYQAAMRAFGRYYTQIGEVDRGFQVVLMLTNQMKDMYMARSKSAGGYLVRESELAALEAEISGMSDEELANSEGGESEKEPDGEG